MVKDRLNNHRSDVKLHKNTTIGIHFNEPTHSIDDLRILPIATLAGMDPDTRNYLEKEYIRLLDTRYPIGLNYYPIVA